MKNVLFVLFSTFCLCGTLKSQTSSLLKELYKYQNQNVKSMNVSIISYHQKEYLKYAKDRTKLLSPYFKTNFKNQDTIYIMELLDPITVFFVDGYVWAANDSIVIEFKRKNKPYLTKYGDMTSFLQNYKQKVFYLTLNDNFQKLREDIKHATRICDGYSVVAIRIIRDKKSYKFDIFAYDDFVVKKDSVR